MEKLVLFCKSYDKDMLRARRMVESVERFNLDNIPLYISIPPKDLGAFQRCLKGLPCIILADSDILSKSVAVFGNLPDLYPHHLIQQLIKLEFWRLGVCRNYVWIDSDSYFIRPFEVKDFMVDDHTPFTIQHEYNAEDERRRMHDLPGKVRNKRIDNTVSMIEKFKGLFGSRSHSDLFGSPPIIWSCAVLESLYAEYLLPNKKSIFQLLYEYPCEIQLYGEYIHHCKVIPIHPKAEMFKTYHYLDEFIKSQIKGEYEYQLSKKYYGVCIQSNWTTMKAKKGPMDRLKKHLDECKITLGRLKF